MFQQPPAYKHAPAFSQTSLHNTRFLRNTSPYLYTRASALAVPLRLQTHASQQAVPLAQWHTLFKRRFS